jgi:hypothetical protein
MSRDAWLRRRRGSTLVAAAALGLGAVALALALAALADDGDARRARAAALVADFGLSDPALFWEARYARNPSLADLHSAFQDAPASLDKFPSGSLVTPPRFFPAGRLETRAE